MLARDVQVFPPGPVFLVSFPAFKDGPLSGVAYLYDNAVAAIALVGCGNRAEAQRIGDAILIGIERDRAWHDGRLRNGYAAGLVGEGPVKLPGWWDSRQNRWIEDRYVVGSDTGNLAWALLALTALAGVGPRYEAGARQLGTWLAKRFDHRVPAGFAGGTFGHEPNPEPVTWKSTEQNSDLAAAFERLGKISGDRNWFTQSDRARQFVDQMYSRGCGCFAAGTAVDAVTINHTLALDAQILPLMAIKSASLRYRRALRTADIQLSSGEGFSYGRAREGIWTEGTAQVALLMALTGEHARTKQLARAIASMTLPDGEYYASSSRTLPTGFGQATDPSQPRVYFHTPHLAALAWAALVERQFNPYTLTPSLPSSPSLRERDRDRAARAVEGPPHARASLAPPPPSSRPPSPRLRRT